MTDSTNEPYSRDRQVDKPGIAGARWWHDSLADQASQMARRDAIRNILIAGAVIAGFGAMLTMCIKGASAPAGPPGSQPLPEDYSSVRQTSLDMQRQYGWSFGAVGEALVFDGVTTRPFQPGALRSLSTDLSPVQLKLNRYFQPALFDAPDAVPALLSKLEPEEAAGFRPLAESVQPIYTPAMEAAYARGKSLASLFASLREENLTPAAAKAALIVDLPGPESVAFAAGAASVFDPVFLFDNWPHPRGVVRAQETLSAAAYYQPLFAEARRKVGTNDVRPAMFVLDRRRLTPYTDDATQFDNRYVAKLPVSAAEMRALGADHVLYVVPPHIGPRVELDDVNDELVVYAAGGVDVKALELDMFAADGAAADAGPPALAARTNESDQLVADSGFVYYGGSRGSHHAFFVDYPWARPARSATSRPASNTGKSFVPVARVSPYSGGSPTTRSSKTVPTSFGTVPVVVALGTGLIVGSRYSRSGSWNRTSGSSWGGG
ncbi:MAG TPA: hypothetical protein VLT33_07740 [Labilithrix sp.]|nr:hypothetical protein [Labilithrix sp.]